MTMMASDVPANPVMLEEANDREGHMEVPLERKSSLELDRSHHLPVIINENQLEITKVEESDSELQERFSLKSWYKTYLAFMSILVAFIVVKSPSSLKSDVHATTFVVSSCICFLAITLKLIATTTTPWNSRILDGVSLFTAILSPYALLSVYFPKWLNWLAFCIICGIVLMVVARDLLRYACNWFFEQIVVPSAGSINQRFVLPARNLIPRLMNRPFLGIQGFPVSSQA